MLRKYIGFLFSFFIVWASFAQSGTAFSVSTPEAAGVSSAGILRFLEATGSGKNELHSFVLLRHGKLVAEGWWNPYNAGLRHTLYSTSKTFTSTAVGFAVTEGKLKLTDPVISFFPNDLPDTISDYLRTLTVKDVLMMSDGQDPDPSSRIAKYKNWVKAFLSAPIVNKPGTVFLYNSLGTFMLSAIVQKVTGQKVIDYLRPRLFDPLGIKGMDWEETMNGVNTGGWGLRIRTEDMAKLGQLYLQKGMWNGKQIIPAAWIEEATSVKIIQHPALPQIKKDSSDWEQGYCYQIWRCRHHAYRADGAYGQYIIVLPEQDAVIAIQSETPDMQNEINLVWDYLLPAMKNNPLPADPKSFAALNAKLTTLSIAPNAGSATSFATNKAFNKYFVLEPNENHIESFTIQNQDSLCHFILNNGSDTYNLYFTHGAWKTGQTNRAGPSLVSAAMENWALLNPYRVAGNFFWKDDRTLVMQLRYIESPHTETFTCHFDGKNVTMNIDKSLDFGAHPTVLKGVQK